MKKKVVSWIFVVIFPSIFWFSTTGCATLTGEDYNSPYTSYINDRTFSLITNHDGYIYFGTAWIFKKLDNDPESYVYYLATNVHVAASFSVLGVSPPMYLGYNPNYHNSIHLNPYTSSSEYFPITSSNYQLLGENQTGDNKRPIIAEAQTYPNGQRYECDVDFDIFRVNFGSTSDIATNDPFKNGSSSPLLNRLNKLNSECINNNDLNITKFATSSQKLLPNTSLHVAGYPLLSYGRDKFATWISYHTYSYNFDFDNSSNSPFVPISANENDNIKFKDGINIAIVAKVVGFTPDSTKNLLGGSSGSLIINDNYEAVAIHFAGNNYQNFGVILNTNNDYYNGNNMDHNKYEVLDYFPNLI